MPWNSLPEEVPVIAGHVASSGRNHQYFVALLQLLRTLPSSTPHSILTTAGPAARMPKSPLKLYRINPIFNTTLWNYYGIIICKTADRTYYKVLSL